jgi:pimeloyl-ACP methyl ester carboxylesterase
MTSTFDISAELTEAGTSKTVEAGGMSIHYHDIGQGEPVVFLHSYGPGSTGWITFHKVLGEFSKHFRCILMDLPNFGRSGPITFNEPIHNLQARTALALLDELGIERASFVGNSQGGQSSMVFAAHYPDRINKLVFGGAHIATGGDRYLLANRPSEGNRATREVMANPTKENFRRYLVVHLDDENLVTDELVDYIHAVHTGRPDHAEAREKSVSTYYDHSQDIHAVTAPTLILHGRYDRMVALEVSIAALNHIDNTRMVILNHCGHWPPYEKPEEYTSFVLSFLKG